MIKKNILVTGFDGFLARNLVKKIDFNEYNLYGIGNSKKKYHKNFLSIKKKINSKNLNFFMLLDYNSSPTFRGRLVQV
jgi:nucleoside-diphosphate-sugar epimerase